MPRFRATTALLLSLVLALGAHAGARPGRLASSAPAKTVTRDAGATVLGSTVKQKVDRLNEKITWLKSLDEAKQVAEENNKPILWVHMLGEIDGDC
jgi:hypothetical protein